MAPYLSPGVYVKEVEPGSRPIEGVGTAVAAFVGLAADGPFNRPTLVTNWSQFQSTFGGFADGAYLAQSVFGYFANGGGAAYVVRVGDGAAASSAGRLELPSATDDTLKPFAITAASPNGGAPITIEVADPPAGAPEDSFTLIVRRGDQEERFDGVTTKATADNVATKVNASSKIIHMEEIASRAALAKRRPRTGTYTLAAPAAAATPEIGSDDFGSPEGSIGVGTLAEVDEITMVCMPDLMAAYQSQKLDLDAVLGVQKAMIDHCELMQDRIAILDAPPGYNAQQVKEWRVEKTKFDSPFATMYWPWIQVLDPVSRKAVAVPPSGHLAGLWSRTDQTRGVHKAPANEVVRGALGVETQVTRSEHDLLNPEGINVIRSFPGRGIRVWGARTLASDQQWRYVNVRRLFNFIEESIVQGTQWVVFEPNDLDLWQRIRRTVSAFLLGQWRDGALFGATPDEAFYVKCDAETNPSDVIERGEVVIEIGIAPVKPAEFVVFRIGQMTSGAQIQE